MNKANLIFVPNQTDRHNKSGQTTVPGKIYMDETKFHIPKNARDLIALFLMGGTMSKQDFQRLNPKLAFDPNFKPLSLYTSAIETLSETTKGDKVVGCVKGRARSFDELVIFVNTYFPTIHYLTIYKYLMSNVFANYEQGTDGQKYVSTRVIYCGACGTIRRTVICVYGGQKVVTPAEAKANDMKVFIGDNTYHARRNPNNSSYNSVYSWGELNRQYLEKFGHHVADAPLVIKPLNKLAQYFK